MGTRNASGRGQPAAGPPDNERLLTAALASVADGVLITSAAEDWPEPEIVFVNEALCRMSGYTAEELIGRTPRILQGEQTEGATMSRLRQELSAGNAFRCDVTSYRKDGTPLDTELCVMPLLDSAGRRTHFVSIHRDVTEKQKLARALHESESVVRSIFASPVANIATLDAEGRILSVNAAWEQFADENGGPDTHVGANYLAVCRAAREAGDECAGEALQGLEEVLHGTRQVFSLEYPCHSPTEERWYQMTVTPAERVPDGAVVAHISITVRKQAEEALRKREEQMRTILETAVDAVITIDTRGIIDSVNPATETMFGYSRDELVGRDVRILMPSPYREVHADYLDRYLKTGEARVIGSGRELTGRKKDGTVFPIDLSVSQVNQLGLFTGIVRDATERKLLEARLLTIATEEQRRIGQELHDRVGQQVLALWLTANTLVQTLKEQIPPEQVARATKLTEGLKAALSEIRALSKGLVPVEVEEEGLMSALSVLAAEISELHGIRCTFRCRRAVRVEDSETATHLFRIAQEAVTNAVKHSQPHEIGIELDATDDVITLRVEDDGVGIPAGDERGGGIGLKIMRHRAGLVGGRLTVEPREQGGTLVICELPRRWRS